MRDRDTRNERGWNRKKHTQGVQSFEALLHDVFLHSSGHSHIVSDPSSQ
jgi:hypothetical protein